MKRRTQQLLLIIHNIRHLGRFLRFSVIVSHAKVQTTAADYSGMVWNGLSVFGNSIVRLATVTGVSSVSSERVGAPLYGSATATEDKMLKHAVAINVGVTGKGGAI